VDETQRLVRFGCFLCQSGLGPHHHPARHVVAGRSFRSVDGCRLGLPEAVSAAAGKFMSRLSQSGGWLPVSGSAAWGRPKAKAQTTTKEEGTTLPSDPNKMEASQGCWLARPMPCRRQKLRERDKVARKRASNNYLCNCQRQEGRARNRCTGVSIKSKRLEHSVLFIEGFIKTAGQNRVHYIGLEISRACS